MYATSYNSLQVLEFSTLNNEWPVRYGFSTRLGGVSTGVYESLNLGFRPGDDQANVVENRMRFCTAIGAPTDRFVGPGLSHLANVAVIDDESLFGGFSAPGTGPRNTDALVTSAKRVALFVTSADCSLTLLFDPLHMVLAVIHAGWRGAALNIHSSVVRTMQLLYQTEPRHLFAGIGPTVSADSYQISTTRVDTLIALHGETVAAEVCQNRGGHYHLNIPALLVHQLRFLGVENIETSEFSTDMNTDLLFSARRDGETGRFALLAFIDD